jgi:hypothetical protein
MSLLRVSSSCVIAVLAAGALGAAPAAGARHRSGEAGGIAWTIPARWTAGPGSAMRVATYAVPGARAAAAGECAVFFFGAGEGGSVEANVERWARQFEGTPAPERSTTSVSGLRVTRVALAGTYLAPGGPMMQSTGKRAGYRLLGAIVEAPDGNVFLKLTGPSATVAEAQKDFDGLAASLRKK